MINDVALPPGFRPSSSAAVERDGILYTAARWTPDDLARLAGRLESTGSQVLRQISDQALLGAWSDALQVFRNPHSPERRRLDPALARFCRLSPPALVAGLEAVLGSVDRGAATQRSRPLGGAATRPTLVVLKSTIPALAVQPLLPLLMLRRPVILKSSSAEPLFAAAFTRAITAREPAFAEAVAAVTWPGGNEALEAPVLAAAGRILVYGRTETLADLERRAPGRVLGHSLRTSLGVISEDADPSAAARGLARDITLFDQRSSLSVQAVYCEGAPEPLARALTAELRRSAARWPPGPPDPVAVSAVHQVRTDARLRGLRCSKLPIDVGTVMVEPRPELQPSPGGRTVRIHCLDRLALLPEILAPWAGKLHGAALAGQSAAALAPALVQLGFSRLAAAGELHSPDAAWHEGGAPPLEGLPTATDALRMRD